MIEKIQKTLDKFDSLSEEEEESLYAEILKFADEQNDEFVNFLMSCERDDYGILIDALSADTKKWSSLFFNEIKRTFLKADNDLNPIDTIMYLDEFVFIEPEEFMYCKELVAFLKQYLKHRLPVFRYWALSLIADFMKTSDILLLNLLENNLNDTDWRIRYWAYTYLTEIKGKGRYKLSLVDRIKSKLKAPYRFD